MKDPYYVPCRELDICNHLIETYFEKGRYEECFLGHLELAEQGYPLAMCQVGYFYHEGLGVAPDMEKSFYWTLRAAEHGDWDAQCNLADYFYLDGVVVPKDFEKAKHWLLRAAAQGYDYAISRCAELGIDMQERRFSMLR